MLRKDFDKDVDKNIYTPNYKLLRQTKDQSICIEETEEEAESI